MFKWKYTYNCSFGKKIRLMLIFIDLETITSMVKNMKIIKKKCETN